MPRGYWFIIAALIGLGLVGGGIGYGLVKQFRYEQHGIERATDYAEHAANQISQTCLRLRSIKQSECLRKEVQRYRLDNYEKQREYADLVAQQTSALWTSIMGVAALIGMALSVIGVALVWTTFRETRKQADAAIKSLQFTQYDYLPALFVKIEGGSSVPEIFKGTFQFHCSLSNRGKSRAVDVNFSARLIRGDVAIDLHTGPMHGRPFIIEGGAGYGLPISFPASEILEVIPDFDARGGDWEIAFSYDYADMWGIDVWQAEERYNVDGNWLKRTAGGHQRRKAE